MSYAAGFLLGGQVAISLWGPLAERYETERPRKLLALDGGGIRGVLTLEVLIKIEEMLAEATDQGKEFRKVR